MKVQDVEVNPVQDLPENVLGDRLYCTCAFCGKSEILPKNHRELCEKLCKQTEFYCAFCLRNNLFTKDNKHILIMTFRSVFSYYYLLGYKPKRRLLYISQIQDYIDAHEKAGLSNPAFRYDPTSYLWFVDFSKVGTLKRQLDVQEIYRTVMNILICFNFYEHVPNLRVSKFYEKYREAIDIFYKQRSRPEGKKILNPTFAACSLVDSKEVPFDRTKEFSPRDLVV